MGIVALVVATCPYTNQSMFVWGGWLMAHFFFFVLCPELTVSSCHAAVRLAGLKLPRESGREREEENETWPHNNTAQAADGT